MESLQSHAVRAIRFAVGAQLVNWAVAMSPISMQMAPVTKIVWVAVPFILMIALSIVAMARKFNLGAFALTLVSMANIVSLSSLLLGNPNTFKSLTPTTWVFMATSLMLPIISVAMANHLEASPEVEGDWQPVGVEVVAQGQSF